MHTMKIISYIEIPYLTEENESTEEFKYKKTRVIVEDLNKYVKFSKILK